MKLALIAAVAAVSLALISDVAWAAAKKKTSTLAGKCTDGQSCAADCNNMGWCSRMVCVSGKWEKRVVGCMGPTCGPKC